AGLAAAAIAEAHAAGQGVEAGGALFEELRRGAVEDANALLELAEEGVAVAQGLGVLGGEVACGLERADGDAGLGGAHAVVAAVLELEDLGRELDVEERAAAELQIVATAPLLRVLALHPRAEPVDLLGDA